MDFRSISFIEPDGEENKGFLIKKEFKILIFY